MGDVDLSQELERTRREKEECVEQLTRMKEEHAQELALFEKQMKKAAKVRARERRPQSPPRTSGPHNPHAPQPSPSC